MVSAADNRTVDIAAPRCSSSTDASMDRSIAPKTEPAADGDRSHRSFDSSGGTPLSRPGANPLIPAWVVFGWTVIVAAVAWLLMAFKGVGERARAEQSRVDALVEMRKIQDAMQTDVESLKRRFERWEGIDEGRRTPKV